LGQKRTCAVQNVMSALPPKADIDLRLSDDAEAATEIALRRIVQLHVAR
jgi:hypothetical protein